LDALSGGAIVAAADLPSVIAIGVLAATSLGSSSLASGVVAALVAVNFQPRVRGRYPAHTGRVSVPDVSLSIVYASLCAVLSIRGGNLQEGLILSRGYQTHCARF
jgi:hypothetical protein